MGISSSTSREHKRLQLVNSSSKDIRVALYDRDDQYMAHVVGSMMIVSEQSYTVILSDKIKHPIQIVYDTPEDDSMVCYVNVNQILIVYDNKHIIKKSISYLKTDKTYTITTKLV